MTDKELDASEERARVSADDTWRRDVYILTGEVRKLQSVLFRLLANRTRSDILWHEAKEMLDD